MDDVIKLNNLTNGRDKLVRLAQYVSRLVWHQLERRHANKYTVDRVRNLELSFSTFRKILRFGRCADTFYSALDTLHVEDTWIRTTLTLSKIAQALYLYADHVVWLAKTGFLKVDSVKWGRAANKFWLASIIMNLSRDFYEIMQLFDLHRRIFLRPSEMLSDSARNFRPTESLKYFYLMINCHKDIFIDTLKNVCDIFIPLTALGLMQLSPSSVGVLGAVSSVAALVTILEPITKLTPM